MNGNVVLDDSIITWNDHLNCARINCKLKCNYINRWWTLVLFFCKCFLTLLMDKQNFTVSALVKALKKRIDASYSINNDINKYSKYWLYLLKYIIKSSFGLNFNCYQMTNWQSDCYALLYKTI